VFTTAELTWLLSLRPRGSATLVAVALGLPSPTGAAPPDRIALEEPIATGRATQRRGEVLPHGEAAVVGDVLTSSSALISVGTSAALAARIGAHAVVMVAVPGGRITEVSPGADLAGRVQELVP